MYRKIALAATALTVSVGMGVAGADPAPQPSPQAPQPTPSPQAPRAVPAPVQVEEMPIKPPARPRPQQQVAPQVEPETTEDAADTPPAPTVVNPYLLRVGNAFFEVPNFVPTDVVHQGQTLAETAEWQVAGVFDGLGFSQNDSDRAAAAALAGGATGAVGVGLAAYPVTMVAGCIIGGGIGALIGAGVGTLAAPATFAVSIPLGAAVGAAIGCTVVGFGAGLPAMVGAAILGGAAGGALGGALGHGNTAAPVAEEVAAPASPPVEAVAQQFTTVVEQVSASSPVGEQAVSSLRDAVNSMPALDSAAPFAAPLNDLLGAVQAAVA